MAGTEFPFHHLGHIAKVEDMLFRGPTQSVGINLLHRRGEDGIHTSGLKKPEIISLLARIRGEIIRVVELRRVDKHACHNCVAVSDGSLHKR